MSTAVATVKAHPDKYDKDFDAIVAFLTKCIEKNSDDKGGGQIHHSDQTCKVAENQCYPWYFQRRDAEEELFH